jgi:SAM-dependent methyltransferase
MPDEQHESPAGVEGAVDRWEVGLDEETEFWFRWLRDRGAPWTDDFALRTDRNAPLQPHIARHLSGPPREGVRILDVGSGPLTVLGKHWDGHRLDITAVDPLAERYAQLYERTGIRPTVTPVAGEAEHVAAKFEPGSFDLVYAQNCIDHGYDPLRSIGEMLTLVKPGSVLLLEHAIDEGEFMEYAGPHQWNFRAEEGRFVIWRPGYRADAHGELEPRAEITVEEVPEARWLRVVLRRRAQELPRARNRGILGRLLGTR